MPRSLLIPLALLLAFGAGPLDARIHLRVRPRSRSVSTRHRLTVNTLITEPGTFEWEWYGVVPQSGGFAVPTVWKITPGRERGFWSRTELSASFDALAATPSSGRNILQASDHLSFAATMALPSLGSMQIAVAPAATILLRGDHGVRLGGTVLARLENARQQGGFALSWSGATSPSDTNPAGIFDASVAYGISLARSGAFSRITPHGSVLWERSTGLPLFVTASEGIEYQASRTLSIDMTVQHLNIRSGSPDTQFIAGVTWNLGPHRRSQP